MEGRKMKVLVLGATGMAGHTISIYFHEQGHDVTTFSSKPFKVGNNINGDAFNSDLILSILREGNFDAVINCIGLLNKDCDREPARAVYLNSYLPHFLADSLRNTETKLIHMSTDCVFSGKSGGYNEKDFRDGETFYDRSKALGEIEDNKNLTFRASIVGPDIKPAGIGLFNWFMRQKNQVCGFQKVIWSGVTTLTLAKAMEKSINEKITGIYHLVNNEGISKFDLLRLFNKYFRDETIKIIPDDHVILDKSLINNRKDLAFIVPSYEQMIAEMKKWVTDHQSIYSHYND